MKTMRQAVTATAVILFALMTMSAALGQAKQQKATEPASSPGATTAIAQTSTATVAGTGTGGIPLQKQSYWVEAAGTKQWVDTNIDLRRGEKLQFTAEGTISYADAKKNHFGPAGITRSFADLIHQYAVPNGGHGELIGRLGSGDAAEAFEVGTSSAYTAPVAGRLFLGINQSMKDAAIATGSFRVKIDVLDEGLGTADAALVGGPVETPLPAITPALLDSIPRRITDENHKPGDMVNILIVGTEDEMVRTFTTAEWVKVDKSVGSTLMSGLMDTLEKKDYLTMPMSALYLFDRPQDYGFAHAEPVRVIMSRNHLRVWKSPYQIAGRPLWCVAATHDIGFERDQRNNGVTHKIDPAIDGEREYVNQTLSATGLVSARGHVVPKNPLTTAKTATGGEFHSDGRILVLMLDHADSNNH